MSRILVVTGTDTGVGKTHMSCGLARLARKQWPGALALKPIESGAPGAVPGPTEDGVQLAEATGQAKPRAALIRLSAPIAPPDAADREGVSLDFDGLCDRVAALASDADWTLVEGAGGLLSPLTWHHSTLDLALRLKADVVVVAADVLGTQNHVLLTLRVLQSADLAARAVILSAPACADASTGSNAAALARVIDVPIVSVPRTDTPEPHLVSLWAELSGPLSR